VRLIAGAGVKQTGFVVFYRALAISLTFFGNDEKR
jgi:hypothetical protein